jgi:hypothetical protein
MLNEAKLPKLFSGEVLATANKMLNMLPSAALPPDTTPYKIIEKPKPSYAPLQVFGCRTFAHVSKDKCKPLNLHTTPCVFLGYPEDYCRWKLWDPRAKRVIILRDVIWNKEEMPGNSTAPVPLLSILEYLDQEEDAEPSTSDPAKPLNAPEEPADVEQPAKTKVPPTKPPGKEETKNNANLPKRC